MKVMCLTDEEISDVLQVISGVLQLGNVHFMAAGGAQIAEKSSMLTSVLLKMFWWFNTNTGPNETWWPCMATAKAQLG